MLAVTVGVAGGIAPLGSAISDVLTGDEVATRDGSGGLGPNGGASNPLDGPRSAPGGGDGFGAGSFAGAGSFGGAGGFTGTGGFGGDEVLGRANGGTGGPWTGSTGDASTLASGGLSSGAPRAERENGLDVVALESGNDGGCTGFGCIGNFVGGIGDAIGDAGRVVFDRTGLDSIVDSLDLVPSIPGFRSVVDFIWEGGDLGSIVDSVWEDTGVGSIVGSVWDGLGSVVDFVWDSTGVPSLAHIVWDLSGLGTGDLLQLGLGAVFDWFWGPREPVVGEGIPKTGDIDISGTTEKAMTTALFVQGAGDASAVHPSDVSQGQLGDCYFLAALGAIAHTNPEAIENAIRIDETGDYVVTFHINGREQDVVVDNKLLVTGDDDPIFASTGDDGELWVAIMEKAFATLEGGYDDIVGGFPDDAMELVLGTDATRESADSMTLEDLAARFEDGDALTSWTISDGKDKETFENGSLVANHAYYITGVDVEAGTVTVQNPWGWEGNTVELDWEEFQAGMTKVGYADTAAP